MPEDNIEKIERMASQELDEILGKKFSVLDDGFIRVVDYCGNDSSIVQAARVSYGKGTKKVSEDEDLIHYLYRQGHHTPFEMCSIKFHVRVPMDAWRQWIRHRLVSVSERSSRYSIIDDGAKKTKPEEWRLQSKDNKQGSSGYLWDISKGDAKALSSKELDIHTNCLTEYKKRLTLGIAKEQARKDLPLSTYTEAYWFVNLRSLFNFLKQRMDSHAQFEIRSYANIIGNEIVAKWVPGAWEAFKSCDLNSVIFNEKEIEMISCIFNDGNSGIHSVNNPNSFSAKLCVQYEWIIMGPNGDEDFYYLNNNKSKKMEREEFEAKIEKIGFGKAPWHWLKEKKKSE